MLCEFVSRVLETPASPAETEALATTMSGAAMKIWKSARNLFASAGRTQMPALKASMSSAKTFVSETITLESARRTSASAGERWMFLAKIVEVDEHNTDVFDDNTEIGQENTDPFRDDREVIVENTNAAQAGRAIWSVR